MLETESKTGLARGSQETVFNFLSDFRNFSGLIPKERLNDFEISQEKIRFSIPGLGKVGLVIRDKKPFSEINITATKDSTADFTLRVNIRETGKDQSEVKFNLKANLNIFLEMMAKVPLKQFVDLLADKISSVDFSQDLITPPPEK